MSRELCWKSRFPLMPVDLKSEFWRYKKNGRNPFIFASFGDVCSKNVETHAKNKKGGLLNLRVYARKKQEKLSGTGEKEDTVTKKMFRVV